MPKIRVKDLNFHYELHGKGHPLVLIPGYSCDHTIWLPIRDMLAEHFQILLLDNRDVGQSDYSKVPFTVEDMAADTWGIIEQLGLKKPHIIGHSMGGAIAQVLAAQHSQSIGKVVLANSLIKCNPTCQSVLQFFFHLRMDGAHIARIAEGILPWLFSQSFMANTEAVAFVIDNFTKSPHPQTEIGQKYQLDAIKKFDSSNWFKKITAPLLVISSEEDILCPPKDFQTMTKGMANAELVLIPDMGHSFHLERPVEFVRLVQDFFKV